MSLNVGRAQLSGAMKELLQKWDRALALWDDPVSRELHDSFLVPLEKDIRATMSAIEKTLEVVNRARQECN
jgi:hypothetical protein